MSFSNLGGPEVLGEYYAANGNRSYEDRIYQNLGEFYFDKLRYADAAAVYDSFVERYPFHRVSPEFGMRVDRDLRRRRLPEARRRVEEVVRDQVRLAGRVLAALRRRPSAPRCSRYLKTNLEDLANHYHALYQEPALEEEKPANYAEALVWYRAFLASFPQDEQSPGINYQLADLLLENGDFGEAAREYERTAYDYAPHERAAAAGYAAIFAHREQLKAASAEQRAELKRATVESSLKFADTFPEHEHAAVVLGAAAEDLYALEDYAAAATAGRTLIERYPAADAALRRTAWTVVAHSSFELGDFPAAEPAYARGARADAGRGRRAASARRQPRRVDLQARRAGERGAGLPRGRGPLPAHHGARADVVDSPGGRVRRGGGAHEAAGLDGRGRGARRFPRGVPRSRAERRSDEAARVRLSRGRRELARGRRVRARRRRSRRIPSCEREALLSAGELYEQASDVDSALGVYERYVAEFAQPVDVAVETRSKVAEMYRARGDEPRYHEQLAALVAADAAAGAERTDRTRYLAAQAGLVLAEPRYAAFNAVQLVQPFEQNLARKRELMDAALQEFERLIAYEVGDVTTAATFYMAEIYSSFSRSLLDSERPTGLDAAELAEYEDAIEEEAFPFEERAIEVHEANVELMIAAGVYNRWVEQSFARLAALMPGRYAKEEQSIGLLGAIETFTYRAPELRRAGRRRSRPPRSPRAPRARGRRRKARPSGSRCSPAPASRSRTRRA